MPISLRRSRMSLSWHFLLLFACCIPISCTTIARTAYRNALERRVNYENPELQAEIDQDFANRELDAIEGYWHGSTQYGEGVIAIFKTDAKNNVGFTYAGRCIEGSVQAQYSNRSLRGGTVLRFNKNQPDSSYSGQALIGNHASQYWCAASLLLKSATTIEISINSNEPLAGGNTNVLFLRGPHKVLESRIASAAATNPSSTNDAVSSGSAFFITERILVTSHHVVANAKSIHCVINKKRFDAFLKAYDPDNDLALLELSESPHGTSTIKIGDSSSVNKGERVFAMGFPIPDVLGGEFRVHEGIVSSLSGYQGRSTQFQVEMSVHPGSSGCPLITEDGSVVGVISSKLGIGYMLRHGDVPQGVTFAVKSDLLRTLTSTASISTSGLTAASTHQKLTLEEITQLHRTSLARIEASK